MAAVSASTGAMDSLIGKLMTLMGEEYTKLKGIRKQVASLEHEFKSMNALLEKLAGMDQLDAQAIEWRNQVREMTYNIEDCIDDFMHHLGNNEATSGFLKKTAGLLVKLRERHKIANKIQEIKTRVNEVSERRMRYKIDDYTSWSGCVPVTSMSIPVSVDPRVIAMYVEASGLVGIDVPRDELVTLLMSGGQRLNMASIVGFGGLGKTTLANLVYRQLEGQFECRAFVSVSQKPDILKLFNKMLFEIKGSFSQTGELDDILKNIIEHLRDKKYFIVIDDLWDSSAWNIIKCAFPENNLGSRVLITTRIYSVAFVCCSYSKQYVYNMRPLGKEDSKRLFFSRIFGAGEACPNVFEELSADILKKCGGLPLAIIRIGSLLAGQSKTTWEYVRNSLGSIFEGNPTLEDMKQILDLSYRYLLHHLKTCTLYLAMYPEDYIIQKNDLLRQWIAEGFVSKVHGRDLEDVAESYFNELINMSMIQPVKIDYNDEVLCCRVHDLMLDLIRVKSEEENFIDVIDDLQAAMCLQKKIRRVNLQFSGTGYSSRQTTTNGSLSQIRSVGSFTRVSMPSFLGFKYVRVLFLDFFLDWSNRNALAGRDLTAACELFLLRYFKIVSNSYFQLPNQFWGLHYLETIVIQSSGTISIPSDIGHLRRLVHLTVPFGTEFQGGIARLKSLRTLHMFDFSRSSLDSIKSLGELTNLRDLRLCCLRNPPSNEAMDALCSSLKSHARFTSLKSLVVMDLVCVDFHLDAWCRWPLFQCHLQRLHLEGCLFPRIPKWIAQLHDLYSLRLTVREVVPNDDGIGILAGLPSLFHLRLAIVESPEERINIPVSDVAFQVLKHLEFKCPEPLPAFEAGAMPRLQRLDIWLTVVGWEQDVGKWLVPVGIKHLPASAKEIHIISTEHTTEKCDIEAVEYSLRSVLYAHHPGVDLTIS